MDYPIILRDALPTQLFMSMQEDLRFWEMSNGSGGDCPKFLGNTDVTPLIFKEAQTIVKYKLQKHFDHHLESIRVHLNAAFPNQAASQFHKDNLADEYLTFVLYTSPSWNVQWGGETVMFDGETYKYSPYIPNTGCLFPSKWDHYGASPNAHTAHLRTSIAFVYKVCYNHPIKPNKL